MDIITLERACNAGVTFSAGIKRPGGQMTVFLSADEVIAFTKDTTKDKSEFAAKYLGGTVEEYQAWLELNGSARCGGKTAKGKLCRNFVSGGTQMNFGPWRKHDRSEYCAVHGGPPSHKPYR